MGDRLLTDMTRNEFKKYFLTNFSLHKVLSMYWYGFAMQFEQMDASSVEQIKLETIPATEKVVRVLSKLYNDFEDISVTDVVISMRKALGL